MLDRDTAPRKRPSPSFWGKKINQNIQTARILTQQGPLPSKPFAWIFAQASHEYTAGMESVPADAIHPHETSDLTTTVTIGIDCDLLNTSHSMSTSHSISHATFFSCWWLEQGSLEEVHGCPTKKY